MHRDFFITRRLWNWTAQGWVRSGAEETVVMKLTLPKGAAYSSYSYLTPVVPADGGLIEYWVGQAEKGLTIYHGGRDPVAVTEADEETIGAFTVANRNDTDGDGTDDHSDNNVTGTGEGTEDEVDLMKMIIAAPPAEGTATVKLTDGISSGIKLWETPKKGVEIPMNEERALVIPSTELPKIVYIEATSHSADVRSIEFTMDFQPTNGAAQPNFDKVKATAIWAHIDGVLTAPQDTFWSGTDTTFANSFQSNFGPGFGPKYDNGGVHAATYSIALRFAVLPSNLDQEPVKFDLARQVEGKYWSITNGNAVVVENVPWPGVEHSDLPNDDELEGDENGISTDGYMYAADSPGLPYLDLQNASVPDNHPEMAFALSFTEFVRVGFGGSDPSGNWLNGSRCSGKQPWHVRSWVVKKTPSTWTAQNPLYTSGYAPAPGKVNEVDEGAISIGANP